MTLTSDEPITISKILEDYYVLENNHLIKKENLCFRESEKSVDPVLIVPKGS